MLLPGERAKVLDFGLALAIEAEADHAHEGESGKKVVGTLAYAAPEQRKHLPSDLRADLFTVGLLLRELLTLRTPIDDPITVVEARTDVSPSIIRTLDKALEQDRDRRWHVDPDPPDGPRLPCEVRVDELPGRLGGERQAPQEQLVQGRPEGVEVGAAVHLSA